MICPRFCSQQALMVCEVGYIVCPPSPSATGGPNGVARILILHVVYFVLVMGFLIGGTEMEKARELCSFSKGCVDSS
jgi:hypothetical protein